MRTTKNTTAKTSKTTKAKRTSSTKELGYRKYKRAARQIEALRRAGVDVSNLFSMRNSLGDESVVRCVNGIVSVVPDNDPIYDAIKKGGTIPNRYLFRRWVMSQMFHLLAQTDYAGGEHNITKLIRNKGYDYQWEMLENEMKTQAHLYSQSTAEGKEMMHERNIFFNKQLIIHLILQDIHLTEQHLAVMPRFIQDGVSYISHKGKRYQAATFPEKILRPLHNCYAQCYAQNMNPNKLYKIVSEYNQKRIKLPKTTEPAELWISAYKGAGGYFTAMNLIKFHRCVIFGEHGNSLTKQESLNFLYDTAKSLHPTEGWRLIGLLKKLLKDNHIDINKKMQLWAANKKN